MEPYAMEPRGARLGRYTLVRSLGAGGMAELFLARADGIGGFSKLVALKRILPHKATNEKFVRMLLNEARLVATLAHPNIAQVYDIDFDQGQYFFAMEYVHGQDLRHVLHTAPAHRLQLENVLHVVTGVCAGLHHAHEARDPAGESLGLVHRDVNPSNVLVSYEGAVKLVDFGVAKATTLISETREGIIKGKYGYMSPEQCLGAPLDRRSDLFAVGILLWEMLTGRRLYKIQGELATMQRVVYVDAPPPSRYFPVAPELERIAMRALARDPARRYQSAQEIELDLQRFAVEHKLSISPVTLGLEMSHLFKVRIDAWREAERAGRSLADHLAEMSSHDAISSDDEADAIDGMIGDMSTGVFGSTVLDETAVTAGDHAALTKPPPPIASNLLPEPPPGPIPDQPRKRRSPRWGMMSAILAALVLVGLGATWVLFPRDPRRETTPIAIATPDVAIESAETRSADVVEVPEVELAPERLAATEPTRSERKPSRNAHRKSVAAKDPPKQSPVEPPPRPVPPPPVTPPPVDAGVSRPRDPPPGSVDPAAVQAVVRSHVAEIATCVSRARMADRDLHGRVQLRIELAPTGRVSGTSVTASTGSMASLESCIKKAVVTWAFPPPAGGVRAAISYPFSF
jgi:TonB family protein